MASAGKTTSKRSADAARPSKLATGLCAWYRKHARDLPWRSSRDPYTIWVSEVMLQQTRVATVIPYFETWMRRFPDVERLAQADEHDVLHAWQGLGYYSRARSLRAGAQAVMAEHAGRVPSSVEALRSLPGVGPYTAGAIASIAFGAQAAIVDGNVVRVLCRLFGLAGDPARAPLKSELWRRAAALVPERDPGTFNQALMELGATVCTPKSPGCELCPWRQPCVARALGRQTELPELARRVAVTEVRAAAAVVSHRGCFLVMRAAADAPRWAGMWQFPNTELRAGESASAAALRAVHEHTGQVVTADRDLLSVTHSVTRFRIVLEVIACSCERRARGDGLAWKRLAELDTLALPAAHRRIARALSSES